MNDAAEDAADMRALQDGDIHALDRLMLRWQQPLRAYLLRHALSQEDAADLAQETFERVFRHRDRFDPTRRFSTWMFQIALNLLRDLSRRSSRRPTIALDHAPEPVTEQSPQDHALDREMAAAVSHAVAQLPPPLREAIILFEYGTGPIKGFAVTLSVGIVTSVFAALVVSRLIEDFAIEMQKQVDKAADSAQDALGSANRAYGYSEEMREWLDNAGFPFWKGTQAEFDALDKKREFLYLIVEG